MKYKGIIMCIIGSFMMIWMLGELFRKAKLADEYQELLHPYVKRFPAYDNNIVGRSGTLQEIEAMDSCHIEQEDQFDLVFKDKNFNSSISPDKARWLVILSMFLILYGMIIISKSKKNTAEQVVAPDGE